MTLLLPALDVLDGAAVRLTGGSFDKVTTYGTDLLEILKNYAAKGCAMAHLVDLSGAKDPKKRQISLFRKLAEDKPLLLQVGGGVRTADDVKALFDNGVDRVVIGSWAVTDPHAVLKLIQHYGAEKFVLALDCKVDEKGEPRVAISGWQGAGQTFDEGIKPYAGVKFLNILCTDISRDGMMIGPNIPLYKTLKYWWPNMRWIASGGVRSLEDIKAVAQARISAVVVGKAIYEGKFTVKEALDAIASAG
jgi:phosphoribosylformimino-5-aminoimidazole carboxamide ribotide isomerase